MASRTWYYVENDARIGPVDAAVIERLIAQGAITRDTYVWQDGMADWAAAQDHFEFSQTGDAAPKYGSFDTAKAGVRTTAARDAAVTGPDGLYVGAPSRTFGEAISVGFKKYVDFSGRASRSEYWYWVLFTALAGFALGVFDGLAFGSTTSPTSSLFSLATMLPGFAVGVRRLHDTNRSGWWLGGMMLAILAFTFVPLMGMMMVPQTMLFGPIFWIGAVALLGYSIVLIVFFCQPGDAGPNEYG